MWHIVEKSIRYEIIAIEKKYVNFSVQISIQETGKVVITVCQLQVLLISNTQYARKR